LIEGFALINAGTIARGFGLQEIERVVVPVRVNLLLIGFEGEQDQDGRGLISLLDESFLSWFQHVEDELRHTFLSSRGDGSVDPEGDPRFSKVVYDFKYRVLTVPEIVTTVFEAAISTFMRPLAPPTLQYQVDIGRLEPVLESFIHAVGLTDSYTLILLRPKKFLREHITYGYRAGFSAAEMDVILAEGLVAKADETSPDHDEEEERAGHGHEHLAFMDEHDEDHEAAPVRRKLPVAPEFLQDLDRKDLTAEAEVWARDFLTQNQIILTRKKPEELDPETSELPPTILLRDGLDDEDDHARRGHLINMKADLTLPEMVDLTFVAGSREQKDQLRHIARGLPLAAENCLVENWVGAGRYAFVDLSAGPFTWGPLDGGQGLKTTRLFPDFEEQFSTARARYHPPSTSSSSSPTSSGATGRKPLQEEQEQQEQQEGAGSKEGMTEDYLYGENIEITDDYWVDEQTATDEHQPHSESKEGAKVQEETAAGGFKDSKDAVEDLKTLQQVVEEEKFEMDESLFAAYMRDYCTGKQQQAVHRELCTQLVTRFQNMAYARKRGMVGPKLPFSRVGYLGVKDLEETTYSGHLAALLEDFGVQLAHILSSSTPPSLKNEEK